MVLLKQASKVEQGCKTEPDSANLVTMKVPGRKPVPGRRRKRPSEESSGDCFIVKMSGKMIKGRKFVQAARKRLALATKRKRTTPSTSSRSSIEVPRGQTPAPSAPAPASLEQQGGDNGLVNRRTVGVGTDCSGMDTPVMALRNLNVKIEHIFSCDVNRHAKTSILENFPPLKFFDDLKMRDNSKAPKVDVYVAGFPCQPFSTAGLQMGFDDKHGRGTIFWHIRDYIDKQSPRVFVLENVAGLVRINEGRYFKAIMKSLDALGKYNVHSQIINTKDHGIPQNRGRIYFVGINRDYDDGSFKFPEPVPRPSIEVFLEPRQGKPDEKDFDMPTGGNAKDNIAKAMKEIRTLGHDPLEEPFIVDIDSSGPRMKFVLDVAPCLTCSRNRGHWVTNRGRRFTKNEMMRLQGMCPDTFKVAVSEAQLGRQIGNAMSVNVLERLLVRLLPAAGLVRHGVLTDRWQSGVPVSMMAIKQPAILDINKKVMSRAPKARRQSGVRRRRPLPSPEEEEEEPETPAPAKSLALALPRKSRSGSQAPLQPFASETSLSSLKSLATTEKSLALLSKPLTASTKRLLAGKIFFLAPRRKITSPSQPAKPAPVTPEKKRPSGRHIRKPAAASGSLARAVRAERSARGKRLAGKDAEGRQKRAKKAGKGEPRKRTRSQAALDRGVSPHLGGHCTKAEHCWICETPRDKDFRGSTCPCCQHEMRVIGLRSQPALRASPAAMEVVKERSHERRKRLGQQ